MVWAELKNVVWGDNVVWSELKNVVWGDSVVQALGVDALLAQ